MKIVATEWLDINNGDGVNNNYRARLVGGDADKHKRFDFFEATPPPESLRMVVSPCVSGPSNTHANGNYTLMNNDVKLADFHAPASRLLCIKALG